MNHYLTQDSLTILLLCAHLAKDNEVKPLTQSVYSSLVRWLISNNMRPKDLLQTQNSEAAADACDIDRQRLSALLGRKKAMSQVVKEWQKKGIWLLSRSDINYPKQIKTHLKEKAPPLLFGAGNQSLINLGGLALIGARELKPEQNYFTQRLIKTCAENELAIISGDMKGFDQMVIKSALEAGTYSINVVAGSLLKKLSCPIIQSNIRRGYLALVSPFYLNAGFSVGALMGRNKLLYAMADHALVVSCDHQKGVAWAGAIEELKRKSSKSVFVRAENKGGGEEALLKMGALLWPEPLQLKDMRLELELAFQAAKERFFLLDDLAHIFETKHTKKQ